MSADRRSAQRLAGMTVLVMGPSDGLAAVMARAARDRGATVALATPGQEADATIGDVTHIHADVGSESAADALFDAVLERFPALDTVLAVLCAEPLGELHEMSMAQWRRRVTDPLRVVFWMARRAAEEFLAAGAAGRLVLVLDSTNTAGGPNDILGLSLHAFARSFAREYGRRDLACNLIVSVPVPGAPSGRDAQLAVTDQALFLASRKASFVNGESWTVQPAARTGEPVSDRHA